MSGLSISAAWDETRAILGRDGRLFAAVALALIVLPQIALDSLAPQFGGAGALVGQCLLLVVVIIGFAAQIALNRLAIGPSVTVQGAIARGFTRLLPLLGTLLLITLALTIVIVLVSVVLATAGVMRSAAIASSPPVGLTAAALVATALVSAIVQLSIPVAAAESGGSIRLLRRSWELARKHYLRLLAFVLIVFLGIVLVLLAGQFVFGSLIALALGPPRAGSVSGLVLGLIVAVIQAGFTVVGAVMLARIYLQLAGRGDVQAGVPSSGT